MGRQSSPLFASLTSNPQLPAATYKPQTEPCHPQLVKSFLSVHTSILCCPAQKHKLYNDSALSICGSTLLLTSSDERSTFYIRFYTSFIYTFTSVYHLASVTFICGPARVVQARSARFLTVTLLLNQRGFSVFTKRPSCNSLALALLPLISTHRLHIAQNWRSSCTQRFTTSEPRHWSYYLLSSQIPTALEQLQPFRPLFQIQNHLLAPFSTNSEAYFQPSFTVSSPNRLTFEIPLLHHLTSLPEKPFWRAQPTPHAFGHHLIMSI